LTPNSKNENNPLKSKGLLDEIPLLKGGGLCKLTKIQQQVLMLILNEHLNQSQIARRLQTSKQNVNQVVTRLRQLGVLDKQNHSALLRGVAVTHLSALWRYHHLHFTIHPYYFEPRYYKQRKVSNIFYYGDWRFRLHEDMIEMQIRELVDFQSATKWEALDKMFQSFNKYLNLVSNKYGFQVYKDMKATIKICNQHLECSNSGVAKGKGEGHIAIKGVHDNKTYFVFDTSKGTLNHEYTHPDLAISDSEKFEPFFNSIRTEPHYLPHESKYILDTIVNTQREYADQIKLHLKVQTETLETLKAIKDNLRQVPYNENSPKERIQSSESLKTIKQNVKGLDDIIKYKSQISLLSSHDKVELMDWVFERFSL
jgi:hypothetical protein